MMSKQSEHQVNVMKNKLQKLLTQNKIKFTKKTSKSSCSIYYTANGFTIRISDHPMSWEMAKLKYIEVITDDGYKKIEEVIKQLKQED